MKIELLRRVLSEGTTFVERSSTKKCYHRPPPKKMETIASKLACFYKTNKYFHTKKNDTGY
jgi:hypothetical protein